MNELKACPFCGEQPETRWDYTSETHEMYNEGYNIECCVVAICSIYKEDSEEKWNRRAKDE